MDKDYLIVELENNQWNQQALYNLLHTMDELYAPKISDRVNLTEYCFKILSNGRVFCAINKSDSKYVGIVALYVNDYIHGKAFISYIGVLPEYQGKGLSYELILKAFEVATDNNMLTVFLEVSFLNDRAKNFYKKNGFNEENNTANALLMKKELRKTFQPSQPLVSISCITYNHGYYIRDALEGFLSQKTNFSVEILIHDDASEDDTAKIIKEYEKKYPEIIFPIYQNVNQHSRGIDISQTYQFPRVRGKYIALCEGDDYWIDPLKLQKQVDIFEKYPDTIICGARAKIWSESKNRFTAISPALDKDIVCMNPKQFFYLGDWVKNCTRMIPRELFLTVPVDYIRDYRHIHYLLAKNPNGTFRCLDEVVAVYREHSGGIFSGADPVNVLEYNFESKVLLAGLFSDDRLYSMKERAAEAARQLAQISSLSFRKRVFYAWQYIYLLYSDFSLPGIKRTTIRLSNSLALRLSAYPKIKRFLKPLALFVKSKFF